jgi:hypothetical protein
MPAVVAIPQVVEELLVQFADLFPNEPSRRHFAEYMTGLYIAEHKTVSGITREFAATTDQSCLNRWLNDALGIWSGSTSIAWSGSSKIHPRAIARMA